MPPIVFVARCVIVEDDKVIASGRNRTTETRNVIWSMTSFLFSFCFIFSCSFNNLFVVCNYGLLLNAMLVYWNLHLWYLASVSLFFLDRISVIIIHYFFTGYKACRNGSCRCASRAVAETWTFNVWSCWKILKLQPLCYLWTMHNVCICFINFRYAPSSLQLIDL